MRRQFLLLRPLAAVCQLLQTPLEVRISASIPIHTQPGSFLYQQLGLPGTHMEDTVATVIGLFFVLVEKENRIDHFGGIRPKT